jgi:hypothetical protein
MCCYISTFILVTFVSHTKSQTLNAAKYCVISVLQIVRTQLQLNIIHLRLSDLSTRHAN